MHRLTEIAPGVLVATSEVFVTNSTVVPGGDGECLVIDPAVTVRDLTLLAADLTELRLRPAAGFATHPHWDHILWCRELGHAPRYASSRAAEVAERDRDGLIDAVQDASASHDLELFGRLTPLGADQGLVPWNGPAAVVLTHDAHAPGHSAIFLRETRTLVAGDMCSDIEIPLLDLEQADPVGTYQAGLYLLAALPVRQVIPGHGTVGDAAEFRRRIASDLAYLAELRRGNEPRDPRLSVDWLIAEHERQVRHLLG